MGFARLWLGQPYRCTDPVLWDQNPLSGSSEFGFFSFSIFVFSMIRHTGRAVLKERCHRIEAGVCSFTELAMVEALSVNWQSVPWGMVGSKLFRQLQKWLDAEIRKHFFYKEV
jgi:hypothetical protein